MPAPRTLIGLTLAVSGIVAACSGTSAQPSVTPAATAAAESTAPTAPTAEASAASTTKLDANTATEAELAAAFGVAGIPNPDRWAREVAEYRPYANDPTWAQLRQELGKYNIDPAVLEQIIALLQVG